jgi:lipoyl(octanoyl) transferase
MPRANLSGSLDCAPTALWRAAEHGSCGTEGVTRPFRTKNCEPRTNVSEALRFSALGSSAGQLSGSRTEIRHVCLVLPAFLIQKALPAMSSDTWRLLIDEAAAGAANMARDEALLAAHAEGAAAPTLRLYRWHPACLSLGRFQRADAIDQAACARAGVAIVRRPSGGRALLHDRELTYAIVARADHPLFGDRSILATYRQISLALLAGLRRLGVAAELTPVQRGRQGDRETGRQGDNQQSALPLSMSPDLRVSKSSAACFDTSAAYELTVAGRKLAGSAQTRRAGCILQHGAIPLAAHAAQLGALLRQPPEDLHTKMIALDQAAGRPIAFEQLAEALIAGFGDAWGVAFERGELSQHERREEARLLAKYTGQRWTERGTL